MCLAQYICQACVNFTILCNRSQQSFDNFVQVTLKSKFLSFFFFFNFCNSISVVCPGCVDLARSCLLQRRFVTRFNDVNEVYVRNVRFRTAVWTWPRRTCDVSPTPTDFAFVEPWRAEFCIYLQVSDIRSMSFGQGQAGIKIPLKGGEGEEAFTDSNTHVTMVFWLYCSIYSPGKSKQLPSVSGKWRIIERMLTVLLGRALRFQVIVCLVKCCKVAATSANHDKCIFSF